MTRIPLAMADDEGPDELPCEACGTPTVERHPDDKLIPWCGRASCGEWVQWMYRFDLNAGGDYPPGGSGDD